jgi:hypothetical protein
VAAWEDGDVQFMSVEIGYPGTDGSVNWQGHSFAGDEGNDGTYRYSAVQKTEGEVTNPPQGWKPDQTFIKRKVHLAEPASEVVDPYRRVQIQKNVIELDAEPNGSLLNDTILEVRADAAGKLAVGPVQLGVVLTDNTQVVEAIFEATKEDGTSLGIPQVRFRWNQGDYDRDRIWTIFTGDPNFKPYYRYKVMVTVKGTLFEPGRAWEGPWTATQGNGPLVITVPRPDGEGVVTRSRSIPEPRVARLRALPPSTAGAGPSGGCRSGPSASSGARPRAREAQPATFLGHQL